MMRIFIYGELVSRRNFQIIVDTKVTREVKQAKLLAHQLVIANGGRYGAQHSLFDSIDGLIYELDEDQVKCLMNYYGPKFRLSSGDAKVNGIDTPVKFFLNLASVTITGTPRKEDVEQAMLSTSALYSDNENERNFISATLQSIFPDRSVEWIASNYPYFVRWLRNSGFDIQYVLPGLIDSIEVTPERVAEALAYAYTNESRANIESIVLHGRVISPIDLDAANRIVKAAEVLNGDVTTIEKAAADCSISLDRNVPNITEDIFDSFKAWCKYIHDLQQTKSNKVLLSLLLLKHMRLPVINIADPENEQLDAYIMNRLYIEYLLN